MAFLVASKGIQLPANFYAQVLATDMDGTFWGRRLNVPSSALEAYRRAVKSGLMIVPVTGRMKSGVEEVLQANNITEIKLYPGIYMNGSTVYGFNGELIWEKHLPMNVVEKAIQFERQLNELYLRKAEQFLATGIQRLGTSNFEVEVVVNDALKSAAVAVLAYTGDNFVFCEENQLTDQARQTKEGGVPQ